VSDDLSFFFLLMSNGLLIGLMYSLIALGFVLVYKATDAINFAQGEFVMIAGFVTAGALMVWGAPLWLAIALALVSLVAFGFILATVVWLLLRRWAHFSFRGSAIHVGVSGARRGGGTGRGHLAPRGRVAE